MHDELAEVTYDIRLQPGEAFALPKEMQEVIGPGHWLVSFRRADVPPAIGPVRDHSAFLNSYGPEDEGLYDDYSAR